MELERVPMHYWRALLMAALGVVKLEKDGRLAGLPPTLGELRLLVSDLENHVARIGDAAMPPADNRGAFT